MTRHFAGRMADIAPFHVMDILARAQALEAAGRDIIHLEIGEPDFPTPPPLSKQVSPRCAPDIRITPARWVYPRYAKRLRNFMHGAGMPRSTRARSLSPRAPCC
jgi:hypothetical protein